MITNHLFGLIQCYSEQGICYYKEFGFNSGFLILFYFEIATIIFGIIATAFAVWYQNIKEKKLNRK